jgi:hypothetical protein
MNRILLLVCLPLLSGCAALTADPWGWMDDPAQQRWVEVSATVGEFDVRFSVPERLNGSTNRVRSDLQIGKASEPIRVVVSDDYSRIRNQVATLNWDYWWGGFLRGSGTDFFLQIQFLYWEDAEDLLDVTPEEFMRLRMEHYRDSYYQPGQEPHGMHELFFDRFDTGVYQSATGLNWIYENNPMVQPRYVRYMVPIGDQHILNFGYFVNEESRKSLEPDPEWAERRWAMARKILDTVEITPWPGKF